MIREQNQSSAHPLVCSPSAFKAGIFQRCPCCGKGLLYKGLLAVRENCTECGLDLNARDPGDGPAFFVIVLLGFLVVALALWIESAFEPPFWVHALLWIPSTLGGSVYLLRLAKALLIAYHYRHRTGLKE